MDDSFRRHLSQGETPEDGIEYAPSEDAELLNQLRDKVRTQAQRLRNLEQYKMLCEERIADFCPGHPMPVKPDHLGKFPENHSPKSKGSPQSSPIKVPLADNYTFPNPSTQLSLNQLQELYTVIYFQHNDALKEKTSLEESLRAEMLLSEEQRTYIEVLKQAIETKMEEIGFVGRDIDSFTDFTNRKTLTDQSRKEIAKFQSVIADQEARLKMLSEDYRKKKEESNELLKDRETSDRHLQEAAEALQFAEEEVQKLDEEKLALLEYVDESAHNEKQLNMEIEKLMREISEIQDNHDHLLEVLTQEQSKKTILEQELETVRAKEMSLETELKETMQNNQYLTQKVIDLESDLEETKEQAQSLVSKNGNLLSKIETLQATNSTLSNTLKETQSEFDSLQEIHNSVLKENSSLKTSLDMSENSIKELKTNIRKFEENAQELEESLIYKEREFKQVKDLLNSSKEDELRASLKEKDGLQKELQKA